jgi:hypothetical protein
MVRRAEWPIIHAFHHLSSPPPKRSHNNMRPYIFFTRLAVLVALVLASIMCAGWKWGKV